MAVRFYPEILELFGALLVVVGLALWAVPLALIAAGLFLVVAANSVPVPAERRAAALKSAAGTGRRPRRAA